MAPDLVAPMVAFLAHEDCPVSGEIYAAGAGRLARIFIASTPGYVHPDAGPTVDDVAEHWDAINDEAGYRHPGRPDGLVGRLPGPPAPARRLTPDAHSLPNWASLLPESGRKGARFAGAGCCTGRSNMIGRWTSPLSEPERELAALCRDFAQNEIAARAPLAWEEARCPTDLLREMGELGLLGMLVPEEWGGIGMSTVGFVAAMEQIGLADQSVAAAWQAHVTIGSLPLLLFGTDAQRERWLRPLAEGRALGAFGLTEPDAGSDARGIRTRAERRDDGWLINGTKTFISNAGTDMSFGVTLLARTESRRRRRPTALRQLRGGEGHRRLHHGSQDARHRLAGPRHPRAVLRRRVGARRPPGRRSRDLGLGQFLRTLEVGRISIAALSLSLTQAVLDLAIDYAGQRVQFGQPISKFQAVQFKLADIATELEAARWLTYRAASLRDAGQPFQKEAAMAKLKASRLATWAASEAVQIHGGIGYMLETPVARFYCDAKVLEIGEGTNEIQHLVIARALGC